MRSSWECPNSFSTLSEMYTIFPDEVIINTKPSKASSKVVDRKLSNSLGTTTGAVGFLSCFKPVS